VLTRERLGHVEVRIYVHVYIYVYTYMTHIYDTYMTHLSTGAPFRVWGAHVFARERLGHVEELHQRPQAPLLIEGLGFGGWGLGFGVWGLGFRV